MAKAKKFITSNLFYAFGVDDEAEVKGVWFPLGNGIELKIARFGNNEMLAMQKKLNDESESTRELLEATGATEKLRELHEENFAEVMAHTILKDWKGVTDEDGVEINYTPEIGKAYLSHPQMRQILEIVANVATNYENYRVKKVEEAVKN